ncbi:MAG: SAM-dependent chlorinase/fluorinase [Burkholderiales bacterium]|nr:SAM-dependent chlorinase/fluorinase [Phycisphaerae bacterium]
MTPAVITFLTDFGLSDPYVAEMKGAVLRISTGACMIDITHGISPQDVLAGSIALDRALRAFPPGTVHVAVVDPGVGSARRLLLAEIDEQFVLAPDNGLITWAIARARRVNIRELTWRPAQATATFHGRDILAPAAAMLSTGQLADDSLSSLDNPVLLNVRPATCLDETVVVYIDHFGNAITNVPFELLHDGLTVDGVGEVRRTYSDVEPGQAVALIGSGGLLEIAIRNGSAAATLGLRPGAKIGVR